MLLQGFYTVRVERQLMERLEHDLLFRWVVGHGVDDAAWVHSTFSKNRDRLLAGEIARRFMDEVLAQARIKRLMSSDHFTDDGTLIQTSTSLKSFKAKESAVPPSDGDGGDAGGGRNAEVGFEGQKRSNGTHTSTTDPDVLLYCKGPEMEARLWYIGDGLLQNRSGLIVDPKLTKVSGNAKRLAALEMIAPRGEGSRAITRGADGSYDARDFIMELR